MPEGRGPTEPPPIPPTAAGSDVGLPTTALEELKQMELDDSILDQISG